MKKPRLYSAESKLTPPEIAQLQQMVQQPQWQVILRLRDLMLSEMRSLHAVKPVQDAPTEAVESAFLKGGVQTMHDFFRRIIKESSRDIHGNPRE